MAPLLGGSSESKDMKKWPPALLLALADWDAMALIGAKRVLSTARPRNRNFPHTCCTNFLPFASSLGDS
eukprot:scaffold88507_cov102-Cyclotella_meneghiniana.AAC.1